VARGKKAFGSVMEETLIFEPSDTLIPWAHVKNLAEYKEIYKSPSKTLRDSGARRVNDWSGSKNWARFQRPTLLRPIFSSSPEEQ
jgi:hypothetical protein